MGFAKLSQPAGETGLGENRKPSSQKRLLGFLELLTRFELVTRFTPKTLRVFGGPGQLDMGDAPAAPALSPKPPEGRGHRGKTKNAVSTKLTAFLELLTRFELVTSSLPRTRSTD